MPDPAVFLDRDGTIIEEVGYPSRPEQIRILPRAARAMARLADARYRLVVVTNQSGIARGYFTEAQLDRFHEALDEQLALLGAHVDAYYACPHHPDPSAAAREDLAVECACRKPEPGMILQAARDLDIDVDRSWAVGDTWRDVQAGQAAGCRTVKLPAGPSHQAPRPEACDPPTAEADDLDAAADVILGKTRLPESMEEEAVGEAGAGAGEPGAEAPGKVRPEEEASLRGAVSEPGAEAPGNARTEEAPAREEEAPPRESSDLVCERCGQEVDPADVEAERAGTRAGHLLCPECLATQPRELREPMPADTGDALREVLAELKRLRRRRSGGELSMLRLLAYVLQAAALFLALVMVIATKEPVTYLQIAVFVQLLVVTLLVLERKS